MVIKALQGFHQPQETLLEQLLFIQPRATRGAVGREADEPQVGQQKLRFCPLPHAHELDQLVAFGEHGLVFPQEQQVVGQDPGLDVLG